MKKKNFSLLLLLGFLSITPLPAVAQLTCTGPSIDRKTFSFSPPLWEKVGPDNWENADHSAQIRLTTHPATSLLTLKKYAKEFPANLKADGVQVTDKKETKIGNCDTFMLEGKQKVGKEISRIKSVSIFGGETLYYFTLIANNDVFKESKLCLDSVIKSFQQKN
ncbi:MAG: hypothetical protein Q7T03_04225 [Deltaproteobacteria bacterium]|nr:hypothetical protein [Deltaproteobacteria bacterium]